MVDAPKLKDAWGAASAGEGAGVEVGVKKEGTEVGGAAEVEGGGAPKLNDALGASTAGATAGREKERVVGAGATGAVVPNENPPVAGAFTTSLGAVVEGAAGAKLKDALGASVAAGVAAGAGAVGTNRLAAGASVDEGFAKRLGAAEEVEAGGAPKKEGIFLTGAGAVDVAGATDATAGGPGVEEKKEGMAFGAEVCESKGSALRASMSKKDTR